MEPLDVRTILVLAGAAVAFGGFALALLWTSNRDIPGLQMLTFSCCLGALGCLLVALQHDLPTFLGIVVGNVLVDVYLAGFAEGLRRFYGARPCVRWLVVVAVVATLGFSYWTYVTPDITARIRWTSSLLALCSFYGAWISWRGAEVSTRIGSGLIASGLMTFGVLQVFRVLFSRDLFGPDSFTSIALAGAMLSFYAILLGISIAIGGRHLATAKLERARAEAGERAKGEFLASMSHEIRTPMNGVLGLTELLLDSDLDDRQLKFASSLHSSGRILLRIIDDILDLSKIEAGRMEIEAVGFQIRDLVHEVYQLLHEPAARKGLRLETIVGDRVPARVIGDPLRIGQVLINLTGNAVKFTHEGRIEIRVERKDKRSLSISVSDTGIGIEPEAQNQLFEHFQQSGASITRRYGGTGLGLAISKRLVDLMDGSIDLVSVPGKGSTFLVTLPCLTHQDVLDSDEISVRQFWFNEARQPRTSATEGETGKGTAKKILVADDDPISQMVASGMVEGLGYECDVVADGRAALEAIDTGIYELVLMDGQMPGFDGFTATSQVRAQESQRGSKRIPIVALTASVLTEEKQRCLDAGMDEVLTKPVSRKTLAAVIKRWVDPTALPNA